MARRNRSLCLYSPVGIHAEAKRLFGSLDTQKKGVLDLEEMKTLLTNAPRNFKLKIENVFHKFVFEFKTFQITQEEFVRLYVLENEFSRPKPLKVYLKLSDLNLPTDPSPDQSKITYSSPHQDSFISQQSFFDVLKGGEHLCEDILKDDEVVYRAQDISSGPSSPVELPRSFRENFKQNGKYFNKPVDVTNQQFSCQSSETPYFQIEKKHQQYHTQTPDLIQPSARPRRSFQAQCPEIQVQYLDIQNQPPSIDLPPTAKPKYLKKRLDRPRKKSPESLKLDKLLRVRQAHLEFSKRNISR